MRPSNSNPIPTVRLLTVDETSEEGNSPGSRPTTPEPSRQFQHRSILLGGGSPLRNEATHNIRQGTNNSPENRANVQGSPSRVRRILPYNSPNGSPRSIPRQIIGTSPAHPRSRTASADSNWSTPSATSALTNVTAYWMERATFADATNIDFTQFPGPNTIQPPAFDLDSNDPQIDALNTFSNRWGIQAELDEEDRNTIIYNHELNGRLGVTSPNEDPEIGPEAFTNRLETYSPMGVIDLEPDLVAMQVALTMAHELTHLKQFDTLPYINTEHLHQSYGTMDRQQFSDCDHVLRVQTNIFEAIAYHGEIRNISHYIQRHHTTLELEHRNHTNPLVLSKLDQLRGMREASAHKLQQHFDQLPLHIAEQLVDGNIVNVINELHRTYNIPEEFIIRPNQD